MSRFLHIGLQEWANSKLDFEEGGSLVNLVDFGTVTFTGAVAKVAGGSSVGLEDATIIEIEESGEVVTDVTIDSDSSVTITYV